MSRSAASPVQVVGGAPTCRALRMRPGRSSTGVREWSAPRQPDMLARSGERWFTRLSFTCKSAPRVLRPRKLHAPEIVDSRRVCDRHPYNVLAGGLLCPTTRRFGGGRCSFSSRRCFLWAAPAERTPSDSSPPSLVTTSGARRDVSRSRTVRTSTQTMEPRSARSVASSASRRSSRTRTTSLAQPPARARKC